MHDDVFPSHDRMPPHKNLQLSSKWGSRKRRGIKSVLARNDLEMEGTHHRALDDVRNIVRLMRKVSFDSVDLLEIKP